MLPVLNIGNDTGVQAQNFAYENGSYWLPGMEVTGKDKSGQVKCDACGGIFKDDEAFNNHLKYSYACAVFYNRCDVCGNPEDQCTCKKETCEVCGQPKDLCLCGAICCFCKKPSSQCTCTGVPVTGSGSGSRSGSGRGSGSTGIRTGGNSGKEGGSDSSTGSNNVGDDTFHCDTISQDVTSADDKDTQNARKNNCLDRLSKLVSKELMKLLKAMDKEGKIVVREDLKMAQYNQGSKTIQFGTQVEFEGFAHETIHMIQQLCSILDYDNNSSNNEFQAYLANQIFMIASGEQGTPVPGFSADSYNQFLDSINYYVGNDDGLWYTQELVNALNMYSQEWADVFHDNMKALKYNEVYYHSYKPDYDYKWEDIIKYLGFRKRKMKK